MVEVPQKIKEALLNDSADINIRLHFPNGERADVCNDYFVKGSVKLTESLCSQNEVKFGLCESPVFEAETVGVGNIKGAVFKLFYEVITTPGEGAEWRADIQKHVFSFPMGVFTVASCERQADIQHRKITAYGGGSAVNWELTPFERNKAKSYASYGYNCDISKVIQTLFYCEAESELELENGSSSYDIITPDRNYVCKIEALNKHNLKFTTEQIIKADFVEYDINAIVEKAKADIIASPYFETIKDEVIKTLDDKRRYKPIIYNLNVTNFEAVRNEPYYFNITSRDTQYVYMTYNVPYAIKITFREYYGYEDLYTKTYPIRDNVKLYKCVDNLASHVIQYTAKTLNDYINIDLRKYLENVAELKGKIANVTRENRLEFIDIKKQFDLMPSDGLEPSEDLKPQGVTGGSINKNMYSELWYNEEYTKPYGCVYVQYTDTAGESVEKYLYLEGYDEESDINNYLIYDLSENELIKEARYNNSQITEIMQTVADALKDITYCPIDINTIALPFVEPGDTLEVLTENNDSITTIVLNRSLTGESYITDEFISK